MRDLAISGFAGAVIGGIIGWQSLIPATTLTILSVGQGSCAVLQAGGRTVLFDAGPKTDYVDGGKRFVLPKLRSMGVTHIDAIVLSHPDLDHSGGLKAVFEAYPDTRLLANAGFSKEPKLPGMLRELHVPNDQIQWLPPYARLRIGSLAVRLACPEVVVGGNDNDGSVLARIDGGAFIGGDAPSSVEHEFESWVGDMNVVVADHHGSRTSGDPEFLQIASPKWVVISVGRTNVYGHPNPQAVARYRATGAKILRTDQDGDVTFVLRNGAWVFKGR